MCIVEIYRVILSKQAQKDLLKIPKYVVSKLRSWVDDVTHDGLKEVRKIPGYHDEPLKGPRKGQRSIRLTKGYRAFYKIGKNYNIELVEIIEVNKHDY